MTSVDGGAMAGARGGDGRAANLLYMAGSFGVALGRRPVLFFFSGRTRDWSSNNEKKKRHKNEITKF